MARGDRTWLDDSEDRRGEPGLDPVRPAAGGQGTPGPFDGLAIYTVRRDPATGVARLEQPETGMLSHQDIDGLRGVVLPGLRLDQPGRGADMGAREQPQRPGLAAASAGEPADQPAARTTRADLAAEEYLGPEGGPWISPDPEWVDVGVNTRPSLVWWIVTIISAALTALAGMLIVEWLGK